MPSTRAGESISPNLARSTDPVKRSEKHEFLSDRSARDSRWDQQRATADAVAKIYSEFEEFTRYAERVADCSGRLGFSQDVDPDGVIELTLREAFFCRVRHCPVCQWRRSLMWKAKFHQTLPNIQQVAPAGRWVFLTLTVKNCDAVGLREQIQAMSKAWHRLIKRDVFKDVIGWVRSVEVTRGKDGSAHPHYHCLLFVKSTYFKPSHYKTKADWADAWQAVMRLDYTPVVDIRTVKSRADNELAAAAAETLKYAVKSVDMTTDPAWFIEITKQLKKLRFVASGGLLKGAFKEDTRNEDLLVADQGEEDDEREGPPEPELFFNWKPSQGRYRRKVD